MFFSEISELDGLPFGTDVQGAQRIHSDDVCDRLTFYPVPLSCHLPREITQHPPDGLAQNVVQTFTVFTVTDFDDPLSFPLAQPSG